MNNNPDRGISAGTILMLSVTILVLIGSAVVLPGLMGRSNVRMQDGAMDASVNLGSSVRVLSLNDIPISQPTSQPEIVKVTTVPEIPVVSHHVESVAPVATVPPDGESVPVNANITLTFGGSIVADNMIRKSGYYSDSKKYDYTENLSLIADALDSDLTMVTLEAITDPNRDVKAVPNAPDSVMDMLADANVDVVALGYSRCFDYGLSSLEATVREARIRNLNQLGAFVSPEDAENLCMMTVDDWQFAYLHYTMGLTKAGKSAVRKADAEYAVPTATLTDYDNILKDIGRAKERGADFVIVSLNWSNADSSVNSDKADAFLQAIADAGADIIVGAGSKTVEPVSWLMSKTADESERKTLCALSLGNLLIGDRKDGNVSSMLLHVELKTDDGNLQISNVTYTPTYIWRFEQDDQQRYRVIESDQPAPDGMSQDHVKYAENALSNLKQWLGESPITIRIK